MPEKYIYNGQVMQREDVEDAAKQSNLDVNTYLQKAGIKVVADNYNYNGKTVSAEDVLDAAKQSKLGFDDYVQKAGFTALPDVKKKESSTWHDMVYGDHSGNGVQPTNGLSNGEASKNIPDFTPDEVINQSIKAKDLEGKTVTQDSGLGGVSSEGIPVSSSVDVPDKDALAQSKKIKSDLQSKGYTEQDVNSLANDFKDYPEAANNFPESSKATLLALRQSNPIRYQERLNSTKTQFGLEQAAIDNEMKNYPEDNTMSDKEKHDRALNFGVALFNHFNDLNQANSLPEYVDNKKQQIGIIDKYLTGDERNKALARLQQAGSKFINAADPDLQNEYNNSPLKDKVDINQYAGLKTLETFDPQKYEQAVKMLGVNIQPMYSHELPTEATQNIQSPVAIDTRYETPDSTGGTLSQGTIDQKIGQQTIQKQLADIGRTNAITYLNQHQYDLNDAYTKSTDPQQKASLQAQYAINQNAINGIKADAKNDDNKYPLVANLKFEQQTKELTQDPGINALNYGVTRFAKGFENTGNTLEDKFVSLFGSDKANTELQMRRLGEQKGWESDMYLPESYRTEGSPAIAKFPKDIQDKSDAILADQNLSTDQKHQQLLDLVKNNQDKIDYVTNPNAGQSKNFWSKATLYHTSGFMGDIGSIIAQTTTLGGLGASKMIAAATPMFTTSYSDFYNQAVEEGNPNPSGYASVHAAIMAAAGLINPDLSIVKRSLGLNTVLGKTLAGIDEATWSKVLGENKPLLTKFKNAVRESGAETLKMASVYGVGTSIASDLADKGLFNKDISGDEMLNHAVKATRDIVLGSTPILGLSALTHFREISPAQKATIWEVGDNPEIGKQQIDESVQKGELTPAQGEQRKAVIDKIATLIPQVPTKTVKGKDISDKEKVNFLYNLYTKTQAAELKPTLPEQQKETVDEVNTKADSDNNRILNGRSVPKPENQLTETEQSVKDALEKGGIPKSDAMMLNDANGEFDKTKVNDYLKYVADQARGGREEDMTTRGSFSPEIIKLAKETHPETSTPVSTGIAPLENEGSVHNDNLNELDKKAKELGLKDVDNIKQLNAQYATAIVNGDNVPDGVKELLQEYGEHQNKVSALRDENEIAKLNDDNFGKWAKTNSIDKNDKTGAVSRIEDLDMASKRIRILNKRGLTEQAAKELGDLKNSIKKTNWALEDYKKNIDEDGTQKDVDELNQENKQFNDKLKTTIEEAQQPITEPGGVEEGDGNTVGISHDKQTERAKKLGEALPERGEGINVKQAVARGKQLVEDGKDPEDAAKSFKKDGAISEDAMALVRFKYNELAKATKDAYGKPEYKDVKAAERKWYNEVVKPMQTAWSNIGKHMMGTTDIDTGDVVDLLRNFENTNNKEANSKQEKELRAVSEKYSKLKKQFDDLRNSASKETNPKEKGKFEKMARNLVAKIMKSELPSWMKADLPEGTKSQGLDAGKLKKLLADATINMGKLLDKGVEFADAVKEAVKDLVKALGESKRDEIEKGFTDDYNQNVLGVSKEDYSAEQNIKRLQKQLDDLKEGKTKEKSGDRELTDKEKDLQKQIQKEKTTQLVTRFVDKTDNVFSPKDAKDIWDYINTKIADGEDFDTAVGSAASDLGLSSSQIQHAIASNKTTRIVTDEMYKNQYQRNRISRDAKLYIQAEGNSKGVKILKAITAIPRGIKVFGHGTVPMETHVGMSKFDVNPETAKIYYQHLIKTYKLYGSSVYYEKAMQALKNEPTFYLFNRDGLHNDPDVTYQDYLLPQTWFKGTWAGKLQDASRRGFDILKPYRQAKMQYYYDRLTPEEKKDGELRKVYADMVNHESGSIKPMFREGSTVGSVAEGSFFALKLEGSRWASLKDNFKALSSLANYKNATAAEKVRAKMLIGRATRIVGAYMGALAMNQGALWAFGSNQKINFLNPTKADWLNFKGFGKTIGLSSGMANVFRFIANMFHAPFQSKEELKGKTTIGAMTDYVANYGRGKLSPAVGDVLDVATHHDFQGNTLPFYNDKPLHSYNHKMSYKEYAMKFAPIPVEGAYDNIQQSMENNGLSKLNAGTILGGLISGATEGATGIRVAEDFKEKPTPFNEEDKKDPTFKYFLDKGMELPNTSPTSEIITDENNRTKKPLSEYPKDIQDKYEQVHKNYLKEELSNVKDNGTVYVKYYEDSKGNPKNEISLVKPTSGEYDEKGLNKLSTSEMAQVLHLAQAKATTRTKKELFNQ